MYDNPGTELLFETRWPHVDQVCDAGLVNILLQWPELDSALACVICKQYKFYLICPDFANYFSNFQ